MTKPTQFDLEQISAYLDKELDQAVQSRLDARLAADADLRAALEELRQTCLLLRRTPRRRAPRNFRLTPGMTGLRPPVPRLAPVLSWASAAAILLFLATAVTSLLPRLSFGAAAPSAMEARAPLMGSGAPTSNQAQPNQNAVLSATSPAFLQAVPAATSATTTKANNQVYPQSLATTGTNPSVQPTEQAVVPPRTGLVPKPGQPAPPSVAPHPLEPVAIPWIYIWLALAVVLGGTAVLTRWMAMAAFRRKFGGNDRS